MKNGKKYYLNTITAKKGIYNNYRLNAKRRAILWDIDYFKFFECLRSPCHYCGRVHSLKVLTTEDGEYMYNGVDRVNNDKGYIRDNIVSCCSDCNRSKGVLSKQDFITLAGKITDHQEQRKGDVALKIYIFSDTQTECTVCAATLEDAKRVLEEDKLYFFNYNLLILPVQRGIVQKTILSQEKVHA